MLSQLKKRHLALLALLGLGLAFSIVYLRNDREEAGSIVRSFEQERDFKPLVKVINDNKFWLSERPDLSAERVLMLRTPSNDPGKQALIDVVEMDGATAGFIAYYKKSFDHGFIWLLAVDKEYRGHGFGERLMTHALTYFKNQHVKYVTIAVRLINKPAVSLYKKLGFVEETRDEDRGVLTMIRRNL